MQSMRVRPNGKMEAFVGIIKHLVFICVSYKGRNRIIQNVTAQILYISKQNVNLIKLLTAAVAHLHHFVFH